MAQANNIRLRREQRLEQLLSVPFCIKQTRISVTQIVDLAMFCGLLSRKLGGPLTPHCQVSLRAPSCFPSRPARPRYCHQERT